DALERFAPEVAQDMRDRRVEAERLARMQLEDLLTDGHRDLAGHHVAVLVPVVGDQVAVAGCRTRRIGDLHEVHPVLRCRREALPDHALSHAELRPVAGMDHGYSVGVFGWL